MKSQSEPDTFASLQQGVLDWASPSLLRPEKKQKVRGGQSSWQ